MLERGVVSEFDPGSGGQEKLLGVALDLVGNSW